MFPPLPLQVCHAQESECVISSHLSEADIQGKAPDAMQL